jgi:hypothetical protein
MDINKLNRFPAFGIHLGLSFVIFVVLAYLVIFVWYPSFFFDTDSGWRGMQIIVGIDLVLGPMLTLVVFKAGKPELKMGFDTNRDISSHMPVRWHLYCLCRMPDRDRLRARRISCHERRRLQRYWTA